MGGDVKAASSLSDLGEHYATACKPQTLSRTIEERLLRLNCESIVPDCGYWQLNLKSFTAPFVAETIEEAIVAAEKQVWG